MVQDPYNSWLRTLYVGASLGAFESVLTGCWAYAQLEARLNGFPSHQLMDHVAAYATLAIAASNWMAAWLLTTSSPLEDREHEPGRLAEFSTNLLRLVVTALFIVWSLRLLGFFGEDSRYSDAAVRFALMTQTAATLAMILLWLHVRSLAMRLRFRALRWRTVVAMTARVGLEGLPGLFPLIVALIWGSPRLSRNFINLRLGLIVLAASISALVLTRFGWALRVRANQAV